MTIIHPMSAMETARLAARLLGDGSWESLSRVEARDIVAAMERIATSGPAEGSPAARVLDGHTRVLSEIANTAIGQNLLRADGRDLSWLKDPVQMDGMARETFVY